MTNTSDSLLNVFFLFVFNIYSRNQKYFIHNLLYCNIVVSIIDKFQVVQQNISVFVLDLRFFLIRKLIHFYVKQYEPGTALLMQKGTGSKCLYKFIWTTKSKWSVAFYKGWQFMKNLPRKWNTSLFHFCICKACTILIDSSFGWRVSLLLWLSCYLALHIDPFPAMYKFYTGIRKSCAWVNNNFTNSPWTILYMATLLLTSVITSAYSST